MKLKDTIRLTLIGDIFPGELCYTQDYGIRTQFKKHKGIPWLREINKIVGENDIVVGNLESPLIDEVDSIKKTFFGNPEFACFLKKSGINVLNVANNHILEQGNQGFQSTIQALNKAELGIVGHISDSKSNIIYKDVKGLKISIAGFSNVDLHTIQNDDHFAVLNEDNVLNTLNEMEKNKADLKILCFHWGDEYVHVPSLEQRKMAYKFINNGADVIVGHHPHVIQPYEEYKNGHIFYSLGNFIFDYIHSRMVSIGLVATLEVTERKQIHVKLNGVKLSYKNTVNHLPSYKFEKYYSRVTKLYEEFSMLTDDEYEKCYHTLHKKNRIRQRFVMKKSIINEFFRIKKNDKIYLIRNLFTYYSNIIKHVVNRKLST
jgi:poly-gamma-glutamate synthesis protein (capsule biosynthesis protein)